MPPVKQTTPATPAAAEDDPFKGLSDDNSSPAVAELLEDAKTLDDEKSDLYGRIDANRSLLRNYATLGKGSEKQRKAIELFYPKPNRKAKDNGAEG